MTSPFFTDFTLAVKVLGPTAGYLGDELKSFTERNLARIMDAAAKRLGTKVDDPGGVSPRVIKGLLSEGPFCDDELCAEYFGGVLASSRSGVARDDRGAALMSLLGAMSTYEVRTHYVLYAIFKRLFDGAGLNLGNLKARAMARTFLPYRSYLAAMDFTEGEDVAAVVNHSLFGLVNHDLIESIFFHPVEDPDGGIAVNPSSHGVELFLWAHGRSDVPIHRFLDPSVSLPAMEGITVPLGERALQPQPQASG